MHATIIVDILASVAESWKLRSPRAIIMATLDVVSEFVRAEAPVENACEGLQATIGGFTRNLMPGRPPGRG